MIQHYPMGIMLLHLTFQLKASAQLVCIAKLLGLNQTVK